jgi:hypothetical protein
MMMNRRAFSAALLTGSFANLHTWRGRKFNSSEGE